MRSGILLPFVGWLCVVSCGGTEAEPATPARPAAGEQTYREAIALMCDVDRRAGIAADADPVELAGLRTEYIIEHVKNPDGIEFRTLWSVKDEGEQARSLAEEAKGVGLARCPLAE